MYVCMAGKWEIKRIVMVLIIIMAMRDKESFR